MTERLQAAFRCADRLPPHEQDELADRIIADVAPELVQARAWRPALEVDRPDTRTPHLVR